MKLLSIPYYVYYLGGSSKCEELTFLAQDKLAGKVIGFWRRFDYLSFIIFDNFEDSEKEEYDFIDKYPDPETINVIQERLNHIDMTEEKS